MGYCAPFFSPISLKRVPRTLNKGLWIIGLWIREGGKQKVNYYLGSSYSEACRQNTICYFTEQVSGYWRNISIMYPFCMLFKQSFHLQKVFSFFGCPCSVAQVHPLQSWPRKCCLTGYNSQCRTLCCHGLSAAELAQI